jgi:hypothetical protein
MLFGYKKPKNHRQMVLLKNNFIPKSLRQLGALSDRGTALQPISFGSLKDLTFDQCDFCIWVMTLRQLSRPSRSPSYRGRSPTLSSCVAEAPFSSPASASRRATGTLEITRNIMSPLSDVYQNPRLSHRSCRKCDTPMRLVQIEPFDRRDYDLQVFECRKCWHSETLSSKAVVS